MQLRTLLTDPDPPVLSLTSPTGLVIDGPNGMITITMTATQTAALTFSTAVYDLEVVSGSGFVTRLLKGTITLDPEVTR